MRPKPKAEEEEKNRVEGLLSLRDSCPVLRGGPMRFSKPGGERELLKKNQAEKFRHKDASVWISTATVKQNMAGTSSDPSWLFQNILIMRHTHNVFRIPSVLPLGQLI